MPDIQTNAKKYFKGDARRDEAFLSGKAKSIQSFANSH